MSTNFPVAINASQLPAEFREAMQSQQSNELTQNVGSAAAVISFKGKVFRIKHGGAEQQITVNYQGAEYAAPFIDVVIVNASADVSKTYYASGYAEGAAESPDCWSENGITPLAPPEKRPTLPQTGLPCHDCRLCPYNVFGSKVNETTGKGSKLCADTRKIAVMFAGQDGVVADHERFGGALLMRVPASSLQIFAQYAANLQAQGLSYYSVVTRMAFDQTVAYPKFSLQPVAMVAPSAAAGVIEARNGHHTRSILALAHDSAPAAAQPVPVQAQAPVQQAAPQQYAPPVQAAPQPAPTNVVPIQTPPPAAAAPVQAAPQQYAPQPAPVAAPAAAPYVPAPVQAAPVQAAPQQYNPVPAPVAAAPQQYAPQPAPIDLPPSAYTQVAPVAAAPVQAAPQPAPVQYAPPPGAAPVSPVQAALAGGAPPADANPITPDLLGKIDALLGS